VVRFFLIADSSNTVNLWIINMETNNPDPAELDKTLYSSKLEREESICSPSRCFPAIEDGINFDVSNRGSKIYLVSSCLVGLKTRYDGVVKINDQCCRDIAGSLWIPVCPEQLGGLSTPRVAADIIGGNGEDVLDGRARVVTRDGEDVTDSFLLGAEQVLAIARSHPITAVILKAGSPSCGISKLGVTAALLERNGYDIREY
jgi:uncharacterized protein YbbK (DUF523 family)